VSEPEDKAEEKQPEIQETVSQENELEELKDKYFRLLAEGENQRKRLQKEKLEAIRHGETIIISNFLEPIDHMENALQFAVHSSPEVKQWAIGFEMILGQFKEVLARHHVTPFSSKGHMYDHDKHEAIDTEETDEVAPGTIVEEYQRGYVMDGRIIRPAKVKVAKARELENGGNKNG